LGGAQFALIGAVDRMRSLAADAAAPQRTAVLSAVDPANPYGAALPWPDRPAEGAQRAGRKAGSVVVLVGGKLVLYVERGGRTALSYSTDPEECRLAVVALAERVRARMLGTFEIQRVDGRPVRDSDVAAVLEAAGFVQTHRGYELRA
jgi:ATP-dependent Lhr-like helicase